MKRLSILISLSSLLSCTLFAEKKETFLLLDAHTHEIIKTIGPDIHKRTSPCSTFKIALSLMGYDTDVLKDENTPRWDFQTGYTDFLDSWKEPQTPKTWMQRSCVWYSKVLTPLIGIDKINHYLTEFAYGNRDFSGGLQEAWLSSSLKISPKEQIEFLGRMLNETLLVSSYAISMTKSLLFLEELEDKSLLFGKTGSGHEDNLDIGWFIGWIEKGAHTWIFVYYVQDTKIDPSQRIPRMKEFLSPQGEEVKADL